MDVTFQLLRRFLAIPYSNAFGHVIFVASRLHLLTLPSLRVRFPRKFGMLPGPFFLCIGCWFEQQWRWGWSWRDASGALAFAELSS
eukprot:767895-Hanusia_phi.AAC.19